MKHERNVNGVQNCDSIGHGLETSEQIVATGSLAPHYGKPLCPPLRMMLPK
jgi:hypothetical protein